MGLSPFEQALYADFEHEQTRGVKQKVRAAKQKQLKAPRRIPAEFVGTKVFPRILQLTDYTCVPCAMYCILKHYGHYAPYSEIKGDLILSHLVTWQTIAQYLRRFDLRVSFRRHLHYSALWNALAFDAVALVELDEGHVAVVYGMDQDRVWIADSLLRRQWGRTLSHAAFLKRWTFTALIVKAA